MRRYCIRGLKGCYEKGTESKTKFLEVHYTKYITLHNVKHVIKSDGRIRNSKERLEGKIEGIPEIKEKDKELENLSEMIRKLTHKSGRSKSE